MPAGDGARDLGLVGCVALDLDPREDDRGRFWKIFRASALAARGLRTDFVEHYVSTSRRGVCRGLHFQTPPFDHAKLVTCLEGRIFDAFVDLRDGSPTFGRAAWLELDAARPEAVYLPAGVAHGFWTLSEVALVSYHVTSEYQPEHDHGVSWSSAGIPWPGDRPVLSARDAAFPELAAFRTPFRMAP